MYLFIFSLRAGFFDVISASSVANNQNMSSRHCMDMSLFYTSLKQVQRWCSVSISPEAQC